MNLVIDKEAALARVEGDAGLLVELAEIFLGELDGLMSGIRDGLVRRDRQTVQRAAHSLKGSSANMAAISVAELARQLETLGCEGNFPDGCITFDRLEAEVERLKTALVNLS